MLLLQAQVAIGERCCRFIDDTIVETLDWLQTLAVLKKGASLSHQEDNGARYWAALSAFDGQSASLVGSRRDGRLKFARRHRR